MTKAMNSQDMNLGDYKCTEKEVQRMFADADTSTPADSRILANYSMDDIDKNEVVFDILWYLYNGITAPSDIFSFITSDIKR